MFKVTSNIPFNVLAAPKASDFLIALSDGHGSGTPGKRTPEIKSLNKRVIKENEFNKAVVNFLNTELKRCGFKTLLVAPTDSDTPLGDRIKLANSKKADAYISVHYDALDGKFDGPNKDPEGHSIFVYSGQKNKAAGKLAKAIHKHLVKGTVQKDRGIKEANFWELRETNMIAILSENGFMDNEKEAKLMINTAFQKEVAQEHAKGICDYFNVPYVAEPKPAAKKPAAKKPAAKPAPKKEEVKFKVQAGAFGSKENADKQEGKIKKAGFDAFVSKDGKLFKVQCGAFTDKDNANDLVKKLKDKGFDATLVTD